MSTAAELRSAISRFSTARIGVLGDLMIDRFVYGSVTRISPEAPVPVVAVGSKITQPGGAANTAVNVSSLGGQVRLFGVLGEDAAALEVLALLTGRGADTSGVQLIPGRPSTVKTRIVAQSQQLARIDEEDSSPLPADTAKSLLSAVQAAMPELDLLVVSDYAKGVITADVAARLVAACKAAGLRMVVDPKPVNADAFAGADVIKPNLSEALRLAGRDPQDTVQLDALCGQVAARTGIAGVVVTAGAHGMYVLDDASLTHLPGIPREVYDVAGAGDSVLAAIALGLASGLSLTDSARLGNLAGSVAVGHLGIAAVTAHQLRGALEEQEQQHAAAV